MLNKYLAIGNLTHDPTLKNFPNGKSVCNFSIAISAIGKGEPFFIEIQTWDKNAQKCHKYLEKGQKVFIEGRLKTSKWTSKTGEARSKMYCSADIVQFLSGNSKANTNNNEERGPPADPSEELTDAELNQIPF